MSHTPNYKKDDNECSGPRPPVPGEESRVRKMTEGVSESSKNSPPSYLNWARTLSHLLEDRHGVELFKKYVEEEIPVYNDYLNFYFACEGLKQENDTDRVKQIIGAIYRFLRKSQVPLSEDLRRTIKAGLKNEIQLSSNVYDALQKNVENTIREKIYPNFLCSDMYINYIQEMSALQERCNVGGPGTGSGGSSGGSSTSTSATGGATSGISLLPGVLGSTVSNTTTVILSSTTIGSISGIAGSSINSSCSMSGGSGGVVGTTSGFYGPSTSASSSGSISATDTLPRSSTLPTLHEDTELTMCDDFETLRLSSNDGGNNIRGSLSTIASELPMRLTKDLLLATQKRRLEIRPPGAHGYVYNANLQTSYNPCSRVDSERASVSSGGRTDSDTMSLSSCSMDGRPYVQRRHNTSESKAIRQSALANKEMNTFQVIPRTQRLHSNEHRPLKEDELLALLIPKLEEVKRKQDIEERARSERFVDDPPQISLSGIGPGGERTSDREFAEAIRQKFALEEDNDQDILDQHVSRVWKDLTPHRSPGTMSPCPPLPSRRRTTTQDSGMLSDGALSIGGHSMRHSKSMPEHSSSSRKLTNKWPSMNTDSGISLFSDSLMKYKETSSRPGSSTAFQLEEAKRRLEDETRRSSRRYTQPQHHHISSSSSTSSSSIHHLGPPPPLPAKPHETTTVVFSFCDEEFPYRTKIPGTQPTLKQFKDYLPKKGNFRFFFKTHCEDPDSPVIQEEIVNDSDILPLFEGKVMGLVKPSD